MTVVKKVKDELIKLLLGKSAVPRGLFELNQYFRQYGPINFNFEDGENGVTVAVSDNFRFGSIVTSGKNATELDKNIKDAILTSFEVPSSFATEASIKKVGDEQKTAAHVFKLAQYAIV